MNVLYYSGRICQKKNTDLPRKQTKIVVENVRLTVSDL